MAEWRLFSTWSQQELNDRLALVPALQDSVPAGATLTPEGGWNHVLSRAVIGREPPGPPLADGAFAHARKLIASFGFSDERIVVGHFAPGTPLLGRSMLLELKSMGLHFLCAVRVGALREESDEERTVWGYRYDTLAGHLERGREWFLLIKDHRTGEVWFHIDAGWLPGEFPTWWSRLGFKLLGRRYQRAWHRLAHEHLRAALRDWLEHEENQHAQAAVVDGGGGRGPGGSAQHGAASAARAGQ